MHIYANGDSNTWGEEICENEHGRCTDHLYRESHAWPGRLGEIIKAESVVNDAVRGSSNERILRTTIEWYAKNKNKVDANPQNWLFAIGWSHPSRREFWNLRYKQFDQFFVEFEGAYSKMDLEELFKIYKKSCYDKDDLQESYLRWTYQIISMQYFLKGIGVRFFMFGSFIGFKFYDNWESTKKTAELVDPKTYWMDDYYSSMCSYIYRQGHKFEKRGHPGELGHHHFAIHLQELLQERGIL